MKCKLCGKTVEKSRCNTGLNKDEKRRLKRVRKAQNICFSCKLDAAICDILRPNFF